MKNYPVNLIKFIHDNDRHMLGCEHVIDWQIVASYRNGQEDLDRMAEHEVKMRIAHKATEKVSVWQDQCQKRGRVYSGKLWALSDYEMKELLYAAFREGQSDAMSRSFAMKMAYP